MSSRLRLLSKLRTNLTTKAALSVYRSMIVPILLFNCISNLNFTTTQIQKLKSLNGRANTIINNQNGDKIPNIADLHGLTRKHACVTVWKCLNGQVCENFRNYFTI